MKKHSKILVTILLISLLATALFACINPEHDSEGNMTLVVLDGDNTKVYTVDLAKIQFGTGKSSGLVAILDYLQDIGELSYSSIDSSYGAMITKVNSIVPQGNEFVAIYTSVTEESYEGAPTVTYDGKEYASSGLGASSMSILADCVIILTKETY